MTFLASILKCKRLGGSNGARAGDYSFSCGKEKGNHQLGTLFFVKQTLISAVKGVQFVSDSVSYTV
jgi:hypothetical protein